MNQTTLKTSLLCKISGSALCPLFLLKKLYVYSHLSCNKTFDLITSLYKANILSIAKHYRNLLLCLEEQFIQLNQSFPQIIVRHPAVHRRK